LGIEVLELARAIGVEHAANFSELTSQPSTCRNDLGS